MRLLIHAAAALLIASALAPGGIGAAAGRSGGRAQMAAIEDAQHLFYNARYEEAAAITRTACSAGPAELSACELRTSALLFRIKREMGDTPDKPRAAKACTACPELVKEILADIGKGQATAREALQTRPADESLLFFLGKLDLNYVWLQLGTLGKKTGWSEYWEGRKSLDKVLKAHPDNIRARVARAWIDYIVDTRMPRGTKWLLGGGNKKRALLVVREAAQAQTDRYTQAEAAFALWDLQYRERQIREAVESARRLSLEFPENQDLQKFLAEHGDETPR